MSAKHTPGPWRHRNGRIFQLDREELTIAHVARAFDGDYSPANGDLLAAAPDLLQALSLLLLETEDDPRVLPQTVKAARAAIAKATGQKGGVA